MTYTSDPFRPGQFAILEDPDWQDVHFLEDRLYEYNVASTAISDGRLLTIYQRSNPYGRQKR